EPAYARLGGASNRLAHVWIVHRDPIPAPKAALNLELGPYFRIRKLQKFKTSFTSNSHLPIWRILASVREKVMNFTPRGTLAAAIALGAAVLSGPAAAEDGISADAIVFGQAAVLEGPAAALGTGMRTGLQAAFEEINSKGGVHGRKLKLTSVNDGYEPDRAIAATKKLIEEDKVFALVGAVGTPTSAAAQPVATAAKVPFMGAFTGAGFLRNPKL